MLDQKTLKEILNYNPDTGIFTWRVKPARNITAGDVAGTKKHYGYIEIGIHYKKHQAHRLAWMYVNGSMPKLQIDHINGATDDNRICNLRDVSSSTNSSNQQKHREGKLPGCTFLQRTQKWQAQIKIDGYGKYLGCYKTQQEAHNAYLHAKEPT
jgi:hypothetical protein